MSKRDEVKDALRKGAHWGFETDEDFDRTADAILALLSGPDDRMVRAAAVATHETDFPLERQRATFDAMPEAYQRRLLINAEAAIRAAMKAAGE